MMLYFIMRIWFEVGASIFGSLKYSVVKGLLFMTAITSYRKVLSESALPGLIGNGCWDTPDCPNLSLPYASHVTSSWSIQ